MLGNAAEIQMDFDSLFLQDQQSRNLDKGRPKSLQIDGVPFGAFVEEAFAQDLKEELADRTKQHAVGIRQEARRTGPRSESLYFELLIEFFSAAALAIHISIKLSSRQAPQPSASAVTDFGNVGLDKAGIPLPPDIVPVVPHNDTPGGTPGLRLIILNFSIVPQQATASLRRAAQDIHKLGLPVLQKFDKPGVGSQADDVIAPQLFAQVDESPAVKAAVSPQNDNGVFSACADGFNHLSELGGHGFSPVLVAVKNSDRISVDKSQQRQITVAAVMAVVVDVFLVAEKLDGRVVDIDVKVALIAAVLEKSLQQKAVAPVNDLLRDSALESTECGCAGKVLFPEHHRKARVSGQIRKIIEVLTARHKRKDAKLKEFGGFEFDLGFLTSVRQHRIQAGVQAGQCAAALQVMNSCAQPRHSCDIGIVKNVNAAAKTVSDACRIHNKGGFSGFCVQYELYREFHLFLHPQH